MNRQPPNRRAGIRGHRRTDVAADLIIRLWRGRGKVQVAWAELSDSGRTDGIIKIIVRKMEKYDNFIQKYSGASEWSDRNESVRVFISPQANVVWTLTIHIGDSRAIRLYDFSARKGVPRTYGRCLQ